jgi:hypothetical protein
MVEGLLPVPESATLVAGVAARVALDHRSTTIDLWPLLALSANAPDDTVIDVEAPTTAVEILPYVWLTAAEVTRAV